ncbi:hypothetical protein MC04F13_40770 [Escherichia coli]
MYGYRSWKSNEVIDLRDKLTSIILIMQGVQMDAVKLFSVYRDRYRRDFYGDYR